MSSLNSFGQRNSLGIDSLKIGSKYYIKVESTGCFHNTQVVLTISRNEEGYFAKFKMSGGIEGQKVNNNFKQTKLSNSLLDSIRIFEKELIAISSKRYDCTTVDMYTLTIDSTKRIFKTDNCNWNGIGKLTGSIFKDSK